MGNQKIIIRIGINSESLKYLDSVHVLDLMLKIKEPELDVNNYFIKLKLH